MCVMQDPRAKLSRDLVALLADDYKPALDLLRRIYPPGLVQYLNQQPPRPPAPAPRQPTLQPERPPAQVCRPWVVSCCKSSPCMACSTEWALSRAIESEVVKNIIWFAVDSSAS